MKRQHREKINKNCPSEFVRRDILPFVEDSVSHKKERSVTDEGGEPVCKRPASSGFSNILKWLDRTPTVETSRLYDGSVRVKPAAKAQFTPFESTLDDDAKPNSTLINCDKQHNTASGGDLDKKPYVQRHGGRHTRGDRNILLSDMRRAARQRIGHELTGVGATLHMYREQMSRDQEVLSRVGVGHCADPYCRYKGIQSGMGSAGADTAGQSLNQSRRVCVAIDCEMVGVGCRMTNALGRVSIVSYHGDILFDRYVRPRGVITDYRTRYSGIRPLHMTHAITYEYCKQSVTDILKDKLVVGHALHNDFGVLNVTVPSHLIRDTSLYVNLRHRANFNLSQPASLKRFAKQLLGKVIQTRCLGHCSVEDARVSMELYRIVEGEWERQLQQKPVTRNVDSCVALSPPMLSNGVIRERTESESSVTNTDMSVYLEDHYWTDDVDNTHSVDEIYTPFDKS